MGKKIKVDADKVVVHLLRHGLAVCGFSKLRPRDWPAGHVWVGVAGAHQVSCQKCLRLAGELIADHLRAQDLLKKR